ncbi:MAG: dTDP-4-dehydrorhamnose reductase [Solirubrobacteraceae bacterium]|nr:dTDP-4-dehydrorhamnose reductase [Solirubrobacteraceae bacterium]
MLGQDVASAAREAGHEPITLARAQLDITNAGAVAAAVADARPDVVINCAAWTNVDEAEVHEDAAAAVNGAGAGNVAQAGQAHGAWTLHISSDYVFDGAGTQAYVESDLTAPMSAYGATKLAGEFAVAAAAPSAHTIVRSSWLFGLGGPCFPATILRLASERDELSVVDDQVGCPTFTGHLARALIKLVQSRPLGIVHMAGAGSCSWFEFAREIVAATGADCVVHPCTTAEFPRPAPRPAYSVLGTERGTEIPRLPDWHDGLSDYLTAGVYAR